MGPASSVRSRPPKQVEVLWPSPIQKAGSFSKPEGVVVRDGEHAHMILKCFGTAVWTIYPSYSESYYTYFAGGPGWQIVLAAVKCFFCEKQS